MTNYFVNYAHVPSPYYFKEENLMLNSCLKLTTSLVYVPLKFQTLISEIRHCFFFFFFWGGGGEEEVSETFAMQKLLSFPLTKPSDWCIWL